VCRSSLRSVEVADDLEHHLTSASTGRRVVSRSSEVVHGSRKCVLERLLDSWQVALDRVVLCESYQEVS
jgi:hypothetical protein